MLWGKKGGQMARCGIKEVSRHRKVPGRVLWGPVSKGVSLRAWVKRYDQKCFVLSSSCSAHVVGAETPQRPSQEDWAAVKTSTKEMHHNSTVRSSKHLRIQLNTWSSWGITYRKGGKEAVIVRFPYSGLHPPILMNSTLSARKQCRQEWDSIQAAPSPPLSLWKHSFSP